MALVVGNTPIFHFSTDDVPAVQRVAMWREEFGRTVARLELTPLSDGPFRSEVTLQDLPGVSVGTNASSAMRGERTRSLLADANDDVFLLIPKTGALVVSQLSREVVLGAGDAVLMSNADIGIVTLPVRSNVTSIRLRRDLVRSHIGSIEDMFLRPVRNTTDALRFLIAYLDVLKDDRMLSTHELREAVAAHLHDLVALTLAAGRGQGGLTQAPRAAQHVALFARACRMIRTRSGDPRLRPAHIARELGISTRLLQRIFAAHGETPMKRLWDERTKYAARLLVDPQAADRSITDIAFSCGFNDSAHFTKAFAARMSMTPSKWRKEAQVQEPPGRLRLHDEISVR